MATKIESRNLSAVDAAENIAGGGRRLTVTGEFNCPTTNSVPHLKEKVPAGMNPGILILDLTITATGIGGQAFTWKKAEPFTKPLSSEGYHEVDIHQEGESIAKVKVERRDS